MTKLPRNISGKSLIAKLKKFGYKPTRQVGSHIRLTTEQNGLHHITIPDHSPIKIGTLSNILNDIANHFEITKQELVNRLF
ncbi:MAG: type II toxin-antitoxin system HicA family toxin [Bacteroidales bacterium]|nr:type II toxin-antitoxin system HicA family toxin [Bacteroidales bacterium]